MASAVSGAGGHGRRMLLRLAPSLLGAVALVAAWPLAADECGSAPVPYSATYSLTRKGKLAGRMEVGLKLADDGSFDYRADTWVRRGVFKAHVEQHSVFTWRDGLVAPEHFSSTQNMAFFTRSESVDFDWEAGQASGKKKLRDFSVAIRPGMQDKLSLYLGLAGAICEADFPLDMTVVSGPDLKQYRYHLEGEELLETVLGGLQALHLRRGDAGDEKQTDTWHAGQVHYLPVKLVYREKDEVTSMELTEISFGP